MASNTIATLLETRRLNLLKKTDKQKHVLVRKFKVQKKESSTIPNLMLLPLIISFISFTLNVFTDNLEHAVFCCC